HALHEVVVIIVADPLIFAVAHDVASLRSGDQLVWVAETPPANRSTVSALATIGPLLGIGHAGTRCVRATVVVADLVRHGVGGALVAVRYANRHSGMRVPGVAARDVTDPRHAAALAVLVDRGSRLDQTIVVKVVGGVVALMPLAELLQDLRPTIAVCA